MGEMVKLKKKRWNKKRKNLRLFGRERKMKMMNKMGRKERKKKMKSEQNKKRIARKRKTSVVG
eukprot:CAMPEP_0201481966 /NCGR_PEP_ID=MMETSP0151_2-20130828/6219_1 /ASSEMBLY_ACC=CAM_ASM_000257 /TAXON_ID=200890 /ORGANISM="Paramoeba atlantica, Strain 621/1 / CCAP 1560/9" /LENGTH=62 /DNA_ID=CAMNT_0047864407 /DNA_START=764 /DNA_END=952 /DNA_ORIENTATION=+